MTDRYVSEDIFGPEPSDKVSAPETLTINLLRDPTRGWYSANLGWVADVTLASVVSDNVIELLRQVTPNPERWKVVTFVEKPF